jgi:hypothetical protein
MSFRMYGGALVRTDAWMADLGFQENHPDPTGPAADLSKNAPEVPVTPSEADLDWQENASRTTSDVRRIDGMLLAIATLGTLLLIGFIALWR